MAVLPRADLLYGFAGTSVAATATGRCAARDRAGDVASRRRTEPISQTEGVSWRGLEAPRTPPPYAPTSGVARAVVCLAGRLGPMLACYVSSSGSLLRIHFALRIRVIGFAMYLRLILKLLV
nr:uncharacterized protein LOC127304407 isoform X2 [Lolium perenne]